MDCLREWDALELGALDRSEVPASEWLTIGQTVNSASIENRWLTVTHLAKHYYAKTGIGKLIDWKIAIVEIALETAKEQAFKEGQLTGMDRALALFKEETLDTVSAKAYKQDMHSLIRSIPAPAKSRNPLQIKGQLGLYPEGRA